MSLRQCEKCSEMVEETKAFCPGCGHAFVDEETRKTTTEFNLMDGTMQLGDTMYNQMLTDMGLNISGAPNKRQAAAAPAEQVLKPAAAAPVQSVAQPVAESLTPASNPLPRPSSGTAPGVNKWIIIGGIVLVLGMILLVAAILIGAALLRRPV